MGLREFLLGPKPVPHVPGEGTKFSRSLTMDEDDQTLYIMTDQHRRNIEELIPEVGSDGYGWAVVAGVFQPEPTNRYDRDAVLVVVNRKPIGYFSNGAQEVAARMAKRADVPPKVDVALWRTPNDLSARYFASKKLLTDWISERENWSRRAAMTSANVRRTGEYQSAMTKAWRKPGAQ